MNMQLYLELTGLTLPCKKGVFKNFANFTGKTLCWSVFFIKKRLQHSYFEEHLQATDFNVLIVV